MKTTAPGQLVDVRVFYPAFKYPHPPVRWATGHARITKAQIVVEKAELDPPLTPHSSPIMGGLPYRFHRKNGIKVGHSGMHSRTWRVDVKSLPAEFQEP